ncbi:hypothetical protein KTV79_16970, partial [Planococcus sp. CP5-4_UN]
AHKNRPFSNGGVVTPILQKWTIFLYPFFFFKPDDGNGDGDSSGNSASRRPWTERSEGSG